MVFCKHCGKELGSEEITYCPSCGKSQRQAVTQSVVVTQNKNPGSAVLIALIAGFFGFQGIGHMYIGKTGKGIGLLIIGWVLGISMVLYNWRNDSTVYNTWYRDLCLLDLASI